MNKIVVVILCLSLVLVLVPIAITNLDVSTYDSMADVNRDGIVDANDLSRLGQAYGSTGLVYQENKTVIAVYNETAPIENAVVIFPQWDEGDYGWGEQIGYTDSDGVAVFTLDPNTNFTAIVGVGSDCNYANFTTNSVGEASVLITMRKGLSRIPSGWVTYRMLNETTLEHYDNTDGWFLGNSKLSYNETMHPSKRWYTEDFEYDTLCIHGFGVIRKGFWAGCMDFNHTCWGVAVFDITGYNTFGHAVFSLDENDSANVVIYID